MKIVYCIHSVYNPGGMERVLSNKIRHLSRRGYDITLVTTDQQGRPPFFSLPEGVRTVDLGINYSDDNGKHPLVKTLGYLRRRRLHKKRLAGLLEQEKADITLSLYPSESSFIPALRDGSKKILEIHFCKFFRLQYGRTGLLGWADRLRTRMDERLVRRFDRFIVLTREDAGYWGALPNLEVIPNAAIAATTREYSSGCHRVIAAGRLDYQKGFDRLLDAWALIPEAVRQDWRLDIFGQGEWRDLLLEQIQKLGIGASAAIHPPTSRICDEFATSAFLVMSSHYEGFPMVMLEAMACGLPAVSFDFQCGPRDIIRPEENGIMVPEGDIDALAAAMARLMQEPQARLRMSAAAREVSERFSEEKVMQQWENCFRSILS